MKQDQRTQFVISLPSIRRWARALAFCLLITPSFSGAWDDEPPAEGNTEQRLYIEGTSAQKGQLYIATVSAELLGYEWIAAEVEVSGDIGGAGILSLFDERQMLRGSVDLVSLPGNRFWTPEITGGRVSLHVVSSEHRDVHILGIVGKKEVAGPVAVVDDLPEFDIVPRDLDSFWFDSSGAVARLVIGFSDLPLGRSKPGSSQACSGFLISQNLLLTAAHCLEFSRLRCRQIAALFRYELGSGNAIARSCVGVEYMNRSMDVAVLRLSHSDLQLMPIPLTRVEPRTNLIAIVQHPAGEVKLVSWRSCRVTAYGVPLVHMYEGAAVELLTSSGLSHMCDTMGGSSGAPLIGPEGLVGMQQGSENRSNIAVRGVAIANCIAVEESEDGSDSIIRVRRPEDDVCRDEQ